MTTWGASSGLTIRMAVTADPGEEGRRLWGATADYVGIITSIRDGGDGKELEVNWFYRRTDLIREGVDVPVDFSANELCLSSLTNWIPAESVTGKVFILSETMADAVFPSLSALELAAKGMFVYRYRLVK